jgi:hypothetical protein
MTMSASIRAATCALALAFLATAAHAASPPHLRKQGSATQLIVDDQPFLLLGGELHNSSASNRLPGQGVADA